MPTLVPKVEQAEIGRARRKPTESLDAYDHYLRGLSLSHQWTKDAVAEGFRHFKQAIALDPEFGAGYGWAARCFSQLKAMGLPIAAEDVAVAERLARKSAKLGWDDAAALATAAIALAYVVGDLDDAEALTERLRDAKEELFNLRFQMATGQLTNNRRLRVVRHDIARIYTVMRERELGLSAAPGDAK